MPVQRLYRNQQRQTTTTQTNASPTKDSNNGIPVTSFDLLKAKHSGNNNNGSNSNNHNNNGRTMDEVDKTNRQKKKIIFILSHQKNVSTNFQMVGLPGY